MTFVEPFVVMKCAKIGRELQELVVSQTEFATSWMPIVEVMIDQEGFIQEQAARPQRMDEMGKERASQIEEHEDDIVTILAENRCLWWRELQVDRLCCHSRELLSLRG